MTDIVSHDVLLKRAFEIARSGLVSGTGDIRKQLVREGFAKTAVAVQFSGLYLHRQLRAEIAAALAQRNRASQNGDAREPQDGNANT